MKCVSVSTMRALEARAMAAGISGERLMEAAGEAAAARIDQLLRRDWPHCRRVVIVTGRGNNAGDGLVVARRLRTPVEIVLYALAPVAGLTGEAAAAARRLPAAVEVVESAAPPAFRPGDLIVDAMLGTGCRGAVREPFAAAAAAMAASGCPVVALDLPSGLDGDTGEAGDDAVRADETITFGLPKTGLFRGRGPELSGVLRLGAIGLPDEWIAAATGEFDTFFSADLRLGRLPFDAHKNRRGRLLIAAGSAAYPGAAHLAASGAAAAGAGFLRLALTVLPYTPLPASWVVHRLTPAADGGFGRRAALEAHALWPLVDAAVAGPGWSVGPERGALLAALLASGLPLVLDADALNVIAARPAAFAGRPDLVLTPHPGEAARLFAAYGEAMPEDRGAAAGRLAALTGSVVLLKGPRTVVAAPDGRRSLNSSGTPALAVAGSGDVLSGIAGAYLAAGMEPYEAARHAAFVHGLAGECRPQRGLAADELPARLRAALAVEAPRC